MRRIGRNGHPALAMLTTVPPDVAAEVQQELKLAQKLLDKARDTKSGQGNWVDQIQQLENSWLKSQNAIATMALNAA